MTAKEENEWFGHHDDESPAERAHDRAKKIIEAEVNKKEREVEIGQYRKKSWQNHLDDDSDNRPEDPEQAGWDNWKEV